MKIIKTEVLVVGGGGAGLRAAIAAKEEGAEVLLVSKTPAGKSTCTQLSGGGFSLAAGGFSEQDHLESTLLVGRGLNHIEFVRTLVAEAPDRIRELEGFGLPGEWGRGRFNTYGKAPSWGASIVAVLKETAQNRGVSLLPWIMILDVVKDGQKVVGALGFNFRTGEKIGIAANAVVLANGGGGALYPRNDNPVRITGDGYALAYKAGCTLRDMEFVQFFPMGLAEPGKPPFLLAPLFADAARIIDSQGEDVLKRYRIVDKPVALRCRDTFSRAIAKEEGEGRKVYIDFRSLTKETWPKDNLSQSQREMLMRNFSCQEKPLRISPTCHFFIGGVATDINGDTGVPGLFAAGEVAGGLHGANRMGGNALSEVFVFGNRAGKAAGKWSNRNPVHESPERTFARDFEDGHENLRNIGQGTAPREFRRRIGEILWNYAGIIRDEQGLRAAVDWISRTKREDLPGVRTANPKETLEKMEGENALLVAEMISRSALQRRESRGAHYRRDFPETDDRRWKGSIFIKKYGEVMALEFKPLS